MAKKDKKPKGPKTASEKAKAAAVSRKVKKIPPPPACFNSEDIARFKDVFKAHDEENIDLVSLKLIPLMLRKIGFNPKTQELHQLRNMFLEDELDDTVECFEWLQMIEAKMMWGDDFENDVTKAFAFLSHDEEDTGVCQMEVLKEELFTWGEPLLDIEFIDFIKLALKNKTYRIEDGTFLYPKFIEQMNNMDVKFIKEPINFFKLDQKTLAEMAIKKAAEEKERLEKKEAEKIAKQEAKRQKLIAQGLLPPE